LDDTEGLSSSKCHFQLRFDFLLSWLLCFIHHLRIPYQSTETSSSSAVRCVVFVFRRSVQHLNPEVSPFPFFSSSTEPPCSPLIHCETWFRFFCIYSLICLACFSSQHTHSWYYSGQRYTTRYEWHCAWLLDFPLIITSRMLSRR